MKLKCTSVWLAALSAVLLFSLALVAGAQTTLVNGANQTGTIFTNTIADSYTFSANAGDSINLRLGSTGFEGNLELHGPNGALLGTSAGNSTDQLIAYMATNSGTFTVLVSSYYTEGHGTYALNLSQIPEAFIVPAGDGGGPLINGTNGTGTITLGRQDLWTFPANKGDSINVRLGSAGFEGNLQLYGPTGALLGTSAGNSTDQLIAYMATNSGTFTVLVSSYYTEGHGTYALNLSQIPEAFIVPAGDGGGPLINGTNGTGTITLGRQDLWTFPANKGDSINVRLGSAGFEGNLQLYGPTGALLGTSAGNSTDQLIAYMATNSGTFTVLVSSYYTEGHGTYALNLSQIPEAFIVPAGDGGGPLINGTNGTGTITLGRQDLWTFPANKGDSINVRLGSAGFEGNLQVYGPTGALLGTSAGNSTDQLIAYMATNSGTFTVLVSSYYTEGHGTYALNLSQIPEAFIVPAGDGGGPLINGTNGTGTITLGRQDLWTFPANKGDSINVRLGSAGFEGNLQLYGPTGALLGTSAGNSTDQLIAYMATNSGTFTVLVSSYYTEGIGTYALNLAQTPEPFIVPGGDQGGGMTGSASYDGTITLGDQDLWAFTACTGDPINLQLNTTNFEGNLQLYGPDGALLKTAAGNSTVQVIAYAATNCGTFTLLVSSYYAEGHGTYGLTVNGLSYELELCSPVISGASLTVNGIGGTTNAGFVLYSTTNLATPIGLWTPALTNHFDRFGAFEYTNGFNPAQKQQFFLFLEQ